MELFFSTIHKLDISVWDYLFIGFSSIMAWYISLAIFSKSAKDYLGWLFVIACLSFVPVIQFILAGVGGVLLFLSIIFYSLKK